MTTEMLRKFKSARNGITKYLSLIEEYIPSSMLEQQQIFLDFLEIAVKTPEYRMCLVCGNYFEYKGHHQKYCSRKCAIKTHYNHKRVKDA